MYIQILFFVLPFVLQITSLLYLCLIAKSILIYVKGQSQGIQLWGHHAYHRSRRLKPQAEMYDPFTSLTSTRLKLARCDRRLRTRSHGTP